MVEEAASGVGNVEDATCLAACDHILADHNRRGFEGLRRKLSNGHEGASVCSRLRAKSRALTGTDTRSSTSPPSALANSSDDVFVLDLLLSHIYSPGCKLSSSVH